MRGRGLNWVLTDVAAEHLLTKATVAVLHSCFHEVEVTKCQPQAEAVDRRAVRVTSTVTRQQQQQHQQQQQQLVSGCAPSLITTTLTLGFHRQWCVESFELLTPMICFEESTRTICLELLTRTICFVQLTRTVHVHHRTLKDPRLTHHTHHPPWMNWRETAGRTVRCLRLRSRTSSTASQRRLWCPDMVKRLLRLVRPTHTNSRRASA
jgi:hypothetical protein